MMFFALILILISITGGTLLSYLYDEDAPLAARLCEGAVTGLALFGLVGFALASIISLNIITLIITAAVMTAPALLLRKPERMNVVREDFAAASKNIRRAVLRPDTASLAYFIFYSAVTILLFLVFDRAMFERADGIYTGVAHNLGDLPFHLGAITSFSSGQNFPPEDPSFSGTSFTYPFMVDFISACLVRAGASLRDSMLMENLILAVSFVGLMHRWTLELTRERLAAFLAPLLVIFSGGLGWWFLFKDAREKNQGIFELLLELPRDYTIAGGTQYRWGNALTSLFVTQRSILFGLPLAVIIFTQWWLRVSERVMLRRGDAATKKEKNKKSATSNVLAPTLLRIPAFGSNLSVSPQMMAAGLMAGMLPLVHAHSFAVVIGVGACLALLFGRLSEWAIFFVAAFIIALPELWVATHGSSTHAGTFIGWQLGWDHGEENVFWFWFKNTGLFIPLLIITILWRKRGSDEYLIPRPLLVFYLPFTFCFVIPNLIRLAPWVWDNIKILIYWYVASAPLVAFLIARLWRGGLWWRRTLAAVLFISLTLAGGLDVLRIISRTTEYREFDPDGIRIARIIETETPPRSLVLHAPTYNTPVFLTGRRSLLGYPGHIWSHGLDYAPREIEIKRIYTGAPDADGLLASHLVDYVLVGPQEREMMQVKDSFFESYQKVGEAGGYRLYKIERR